MNSDSLEILKNARKDMRSGIITRSQYEGIILTVAKSELEAVIIYDGGEVTLAPKSAIYVPYFEEV